MKKLTKQSLDELAKVMPVLSEEVQISLIGGGDGSMSNPYTVQEFDQMSDSGTWTGGYVSGLGYIGTTSVTVVATFTGQRQGLDDIYSLYHNAKENYVVGGTTGTLNIWKEIIGYMTSSGINEVWINSGGSYIDPRNGNIIIKGKKL